MSCASNRIWIAAVTCSALMIAPSARADRGDQLAQLLAEDGADYDLFGWSVAISGTTAIVGAVWDDVVTNDSGSAYLFDVSDPKNPVQIAQLFPDDGGQDDEFGWSVAISGSIAIVAAVYDNDNGTDSGSAYLFDVSDPKNPVQIAKLLPDDGAAEDRFGKAVAVSAATALVGVSSDDDNGDASGSAYLFDTITGLQIAKLLPNDGAAYDFFGASVAIGGPPGNEVVFVGASGSDASGSVYLFDLRDPKKPLQMAKLLPEDGARGDAFGVSVAIGGPPGNELMIVGASGDDDNGDYAGSAYVFDISDPTNPKQIAKLLPDDGAAEDLFGRDVAISGTTALIGAPWDDDNGDYSGSAYLFDTVTGEQIAKLLPTDGGGFTPGDWFGYCVGISDGVAIAGARWWDNDEVGPDFGSAYLFDASGAPLCSWDLNGDSTVGTGDLILLLGSWGDPYGTADLIELLGNWGPCPK